jgi:hypothetical protein
MGEEPALKVQAVAIGTSEAPLTIELFRWSTDGERGPMLAAFAAPAPGDCRRYERPLGKLTQFPLV